MKMKYFCFIALVIIVISACCVFVSFRSAPVVVSKNIKFYYRDSLTINKKFTVTLKTDSLTESSNVPYFQVFIDGFGSNVLSFLNPANNSIYFYNLKNGEYIKKIHLEEYGISNRQKVQGYDVINDDSLLVYGYANSRLYLISQKEKEMIFRKTVGDVINTKLSSVFPYVSTRTPILYDDTRKSVYMTGAFADEGGTFAQDKGRNVLAVLKPNTGAVTYHVNYPSMYWGTNWGGIGGFRQAFYDLAEQHDLIFSFMADHSITVFNPVANSSKRYYAGSKYISSIGSLPFSNNYYKAIQEYDIYKYYCQTPSYSVIKYDRFRKLYYRIAELPVKNFNAATKMGTYKQKSLIILDQYHRKIGETLLPDFIYDTNSLLVVKDGLMLKVIDKDEDVIKFDVFALSSTNSTL